LGEYQEKSVIPFLKPIMYVDHQSLKDQTSTHIELLLYAKNTSDKKKSLVSDKNKSGLLDSWWPT